uniref:Variant surface glycoprotein 1611 n=1 Tax=Trypanosoma brucei TaxID=5691 RepID=M4SYV7_9TRYP|nr:variant surface glycoprotein 1611 [Trypanosoma brucei]
MANYSAFLQVKVSIVVLAFCGLVRHGTSLHGPAKQATTPCTAATQLRELGHNSAAILGTVMAKVTQPQLKDQKIRLAALTFSDPNKSAALALAAKRSQRALTILQEVTKKLTAIAKEIQVVSRLAGTAETLAKIETLQLEDISKVTANNFATIVSTKLKFKVEPKQHGACNKGSEQREEKSEGAAPDTANFNKISVVTAEVPAEQTTAGKELSICGDGSAGTITGTESCENGQGTNIGIKDGKLLKITTAQTHIDSTARGGPEYTTVSAASAIPSAQTYAAELKLVAAMLTAARELDTATALPDPNADYDETIIKDAIEKTLGGAEASTTKTELTPVVDRTAKELFG